MLGGGLISDVNCEVEVDFGKLHVKEVTRGASSSLALPRSSRAQGVNLERIHLAPLVKAIRDASGKVRSDIAYIIPPLTKYRIPQASYYDNQNRPTAALYRARQPYLVRNALTGIGIFAFVAGVCK